MFQFITWVFSGVKGKTLKLLHTNFGKPCLHITMLELKGLALLLSVKQNCNASAYKNILVNCVLPILRQIFGKGSHPYGCDVQVSINL